MPSNCTGVKNVFRFPLDFSVVAGRALKRIYPRAIVLVELEVWYNMVRMATRRGIPVVVVNGRLTERSARSGAAAYPKGVFSVDVHGRGEEAIFFARATANTCKAGSFDQSGDFVEPLRFAWNNGQHRREFVLRGRYLSSRRGAGRGCAG